MSARGLEATLYPWGKAAALWLEARGEFSSYLQGGSRQDFSAGKGNRLFIFRNNPCVAFMC